MQKHLGLRSDEDFRRARQQGRSFATPLVVLYARRSGTDRVRVGFVVGKRLGKATVRNRVKRRLREAVRLIVPHLAPGWDLVFVARGAAPMATFADLRQAVLDVLQRAGVYVGPPARGKQPPGGLTDRREMPTSEGAWG